MPVSILILTLNEEVNLLRCLNAHQWCDDIVVLDSYSTDSTIHIAEQFNARIVQRKFDGYASQRNYGLNEIEYKYPWVFMLDADEVVDDALATEIRKTCSSSEDQICLYRVKRKDFLMGKWLRRSSGYPTWFGRLIRKGRAWVEREINEEYHTDGKVGYLQGHLVHYPFSKGFHAWLDKHNRYSSMEAQKIVLQKAEPFIIDDFHSKDPAMRRKALKSLLYRLPTRPLLVFLALYVLRFGWLDGRAGLTFCLLRAFYEYMIDCKVKEMRLLQNGSHL
jgi:glycosyltransferase involved in cell wall biosynthesis